MMTTATTNRHELPGLVISGTAPHPAAVIAVDEAPAAPAVPDVIATPAAVAPAPRPLPPLFNLPDLIVPLGATFLAGTIGFLTRRHPSPPAVLARTLTGAITNVAWFNLTAFRAWHLRWGATKEEAECPLPGDDVLTHCEGESTRAITINAPPEQIWPWLVQMGYDRGGWYSYDQLDNGGHPSATRILPEYQQIRVGDVLPAGEEDAPGFRVIALEPNRALVLRMTYAFGAYAGDLVWVFALVPVDATQTRLLIRSHFASAHTLPARIVNGISGTVPIDFFMTRKQLKEIKRLVEAA
jgi:hypothetical protein